MTILKDECGQGAAEYILLFGGVIVVAIAVLLIYKTYFVTTSQYTSQDVPSVRSTV